MAYIFDFFVWLFGSAVSVFKVSIPAVGEFNLLYMLGAALLVSCLLSLVFHNK